jgi:hypothetical protein
VQLPHGIGVIDAASTARVSGADSAEQDGIGGQIQIGARGDDNRIFSRSPVL